MSESLVGRWIIAESHVRGYLDMFLMSSETEKTLRVNRKPYGGVLNKRKQSLEMLGVFDTYEEAMKVRDRTQAKRTELWPRKVRK